MTTRPIGERPGMAAYGTELTGLEGTAVGVGGASA